MLIKLRIKLYRLVFCTERKCISLMASKLKAGNKQPVWRKMEEGTKEIRE
jgi:hypothetical protein